MEDEPCLSNQTAQEEAQTHPLTEEDAQEENERPDQERLDRITAIGSEYSSPNSRHPNHLIRRSIRQRWLPDHLAVAVVQRLVRIGLDESDERYSARDRITALRCVIAAGAVDAARDRTQTLDNHASAQEARNVLRAALADPEKRKRLLSFAPFREETVVLDSTPSIPEAQAEPFVGPEPGAAAFTWPPPDGPDGRRHLAQPIT